MIASAESGWTSQPAAAWRLLGILGAVFVLVGGIDTLLIWYPLSFGTPEWEFGSITASLDGLPVPTMGLVLLMASALHSGSVRLAKIVAVLMLILAVVILLAAVLYAINIPLALRAVQNAGPVATQGMKKSIIKAAVQVLSYPAGYVLMAMRTFKLSRSST